MVKSMCPGVSIRFSLCPFQLNVTAAEVIVIPEMKISQFLHSRSEKIQTSIPLLVHEVGDRVAVVHFAHVRDSARVKEHPLRRRCLP